MMKYHKLMNSFMQPISARYFSKNFRTNNLALEEALIRQTLDQNRPLTANEWRELRDKLTTMKLKNRASLNIDTMILGNCRPTQLEVGKSFINYLREAGQQPTASTLVNLLTLYHKASKAGTEITKDDQRDIIDMYEDLLKKFSVFDSTLGEGVIFGLVLTDEWRKSLDILDSIKIMSKPASIVYSAIIRRAIQDGDEPIVWNLMNDMVTDCTVLHNDIFTAYIAYCEKNAESFVQTINKMLRFIKENRIVVSSVVADDLQRAFARFNHICSVTCISKEGECPSCRKRLRNVHVSDDEFNRLSSHVLDKILIGGNIFIKSTPQELKSFITFIDRTKPYDFVIDGLNVAHTNDSTNSQELAHILADVVKHFVHRKKTILVIGRKHMARWSNGPMSFIRRNSHLFLTENSSQDDPFFLYSALRSGPRTDFVSRDLIRNHAFKLDKDLRVVFERWQQQHQHKIEFVEPNGNVRFEEQIQFDMTAQQVDGCWHIPFENDKRCGFHKNNHELRQNWLCVSRGV